MQIRMLHVADAPAHSLFSSLDQDAQEAVKQCLDEYNAMLSQLEDQKRGEITRLMGMKMEQVKWSAVAVDTSVSRMCARARVRMVVP